MSTPLSPLSRHPLPRPLSPDLPTKDALYLFANFSSYMRSPQEGAHGITNSEDFRDAIRLLDFARSLASNSATNVHVLHLKYRFNPPAETFRSPYASGDYRRPINHMDATGRLRNPVPQPFSVLHDPVVKIDLKESGVFHPLPAEAIFAHISKACQPSPRIIVVSYVGSIATQNHLAAISKWAVASSPPIYVFSPFETRIRETLPLHKALLHAIPMSMYDTVLRPSLSDFSHSSPIVNKSNSNALLPSTTSTTITTATTTLVKDATSNNETPISITPTESCGIPLWSLAPGINALQGSLSASLGVKLSDFSAIRLGHCEDGVGRGANNEAVWRCLNLREESSRIPSPISEGKGQGSEKEDAKGGATEGVEIGLNSGRAKAENVASNPQVIKSKTSSASGLAHPRRSIDSWMASHSPPRRHSINLLDLATQINELASGIQSRSGSGSEDYIKVTSVPVESALTRGEILDMSLDLLSARVSD